MIFCFFSIPASVGAGKTDELDEQLSSKVVIISDVGKDMHLCLECLCFFLVETLYLLGDFCKPRVCECTLCTVVRLKAT